MNEEELIYERYVASKGGENIQGYVNALEEVKKQIPSLPERDTTDMWSKGERHSAVENDIDNIIKSLQIEINLINKDKDKYLEWQNGTTVLEALKDIDYTDIHDILKNVREPKAPLRNKLIIMWTAFQSMEKTDNYE